MDEPSCSGCRQRDAIIARLQQQLATLTQRVRLLEQQRANNASNSSLPPSANPPIEGEEPTNNHAERVLRGAVLWRKGSFGRTSKGGCRFVERLLTGAQRLRLQGRPVLTYLYEALCAHRKGVLAPKLLPVG